MIRTRTLIASFLALNAGLLLATGARAGSWQTNAPFGATLQGDLYTPTTPAASPAIMVAIHYCTGHASNAHGWFQSAADAAGFYIIAPDAGKQCFDSSLSRGGDRDAIVKMVNYVVMNKSADKTRVFVAGLSSGGCMTNTLLALYPDVFVGGAAMPGFTAGGWPSGDTTCTKCGSSPPSTDGKYWGDMVRSAFAWDGARPCSQQWVGGGDEYNFNGWLPAVAAQFQNLSNLSAGMSGTGAPNGWTRTEYKDSAGNVRLQTNLGPSSQKHDLTGANLFGQVVSFLGIDKATGACGVTTTGTGGMGAGGNGSGGMSAGGAGGAGGAGNTGTGGDATGGMSAGGMPATGGTTSASGGASSGGMGTGGAVATGGTVATGGAGGSTGGTMTATGGTVATGGTSTMGGTTSVTTGGSTSTMGGSSTTGGKPSGGAPGTGGTTVPGMSNAAGDDTTDSGGCSIVAGKTSGGIAGLIAVALGALFVCRRRTRN